MYDTQTTSMAHTQPTSPEAAFGALLTKGVLASVEADLYGPLPERVIGDELDDDALEAIVGGYKVDNIATTLFTPWKRKLSN